MPGTLQVRRTGPDDAAQWDAFVGAAPESQFAHLSGWRQIIERVQGHEYLGLAAVDEAGGWHGVLPAIRMKTPLLGHVLISMPFLNYGGPVGTPDAQRMLVSHLIAEAERTGASEVQLRTRFEGATDLPPDARKIYVTLDLSDGDAAVWARFPSKLRSQIRRPIKEGMVLKTGPDQLDAFYGVFARNMRDLGTPVHSRRFFEAIRSTFDQAVFATVYLGEIPVGAACGFVWQDEFEITWASTIREYNRLSPNMLLYWGLMEEMARLGVKRFNFGRSSPDTGPHRFKMQWGSTEHVLPWVAWPERPAGPGGHSGLRRAAAAAWSRLPVPVANRLGPLVAARLPWW